MDSPAPSSSWHRRRPDAPVNPQISLRTYVYIDSLQPQLAEYMATVSQGFLPVPGDACLWIEVSPGMAVHRLTDTALKATRVHLAQQVVERAYGSVSPGELAEARDWVLEDPIATTTVVTPDGSMAVLLVEIAYKPGEFRHRIPLPYR